MIILKRYDFIERFCYMLREQLEKDLSAEDNIDKMIYDTEKVMNKIFKKVGEK